MLFMFSVIFARPIIFEPAGTITGWKPIRKVHLQVQRPSVEANAIARLHHEALQALLEGQALGPGGVREEGLYPQLIFIHIHQLSRILYTLVQLDTVNIYWWWCINSCRVPIITRITTPNTTKT